MNRVKVEYNKYMNSLELTFASKKVQDELWDELYEGGAVFGTLANEDQTLVIQLDNINYKD